MPRESKRHKIVEAAALIVHNRGIDALTLDAVAEEAKVSKGGLLYHFRSKEALVEGLVLHMNNVYRTNVEDAVYDDINRNGKWTRAIIKATYDQSLKNTETSAGMLAAQGINPDLLKPLQQTYANWQENISTDGIDPVQATILRLAADGLWFSEIFGLAPLDEKLRKQVLDRLMQQTYDKENE
ncbi:TetR/AcrR family transcriptional regulator [Pseudalkalibacillus berkeleyi]|uniref:TetR/AcrR family transcriptional regulator n=1 Tax=Pseudalkalibacillus berkeleyi TaxID=1069813 RepID=A0ABS9H452_9BACL|nr:TetR/AcrR family transcriptional regulator [Pseudalkalibacillus berkeleyi]MCF6138445.1 TetR/AcrR family transcriptional regulator [Pseudalkalibacillus berkeleyi]